jgi:hypothetical protein
MREAVRVEVARADGRENGVGHAVALAACGPVGVVADDVAAVRATSLADIVERADLLAVRLTAEAGCTLDCLTEIVGQTTVTPSGRPSSARQRSQKMKVTATYLPQHPLRGHSLLRGIASAPHGMDAFWAGSGAVPVLMQIFWPI